MSLTVEFDCLNCFLSGPATGEETAFRCLFYAICVRIIHVEKLRGICSLHNEFYSIIICILDVYYNEMSTVVL